MRREFSAGGVVVRSMRGSLWIAAIRPGGKDVWALPKGLVGSGESPAETAGREVTEETGVEGRLVTKPASPSEARSRACSVPLSL